MLAAGWGWIFFQAVIPILLNGKPSSKRAHALPFRVGSEELMENEVSSVGISAAIFSLSSEKAFPQIPKLKMACFVSVYEL